VNEIHPPAPNRQNTQRPAYRYVILILIVLITVVLAWRLLKLRNAAPDGAKTHSVTVEPAVPRGPLTPDEKSVIALFKKASPGVVYITIVAVERDPFTMRAEIPRGTGSGFVWDKQGHIVTNYHVIKGTDRAEVAFANHTALDAVLIGIEPHKDLAVLKLVNPPKDLTPLPLGTSHDLQVGQTVLAIGNPFGFDHTLTTGVISGLEREIQSLTKRPIKGAIQTDAAINPGNSGGPLLDSAGRVIGINTQIYSPSGTYAGVGFAVPVDTVRRIVPQLIKYGRAVRPGIGVTHIPDTVTRKLGISGVLFWHVVPGSPAAKAGLRPTTASGRRRVTLGDIIIGIGNTRIQSSTDLFRAIDNARVDSTITLTIQRGRSRLSLKVQVVEFGGRPERP
jgi:S1-C subfamily serine protease